MGVITYKAYSKLWLTNDRRRL